MWYTAATLDPRRELLRTAPSSLLLRSKSNTRNTTTSHASPPPAAAARVIRPSTTMMASSSGPLPLSHSKRHLAASSSSSSLSLLSSSMIETTKIRGVQAILSQKLIRFGDHKARWSMILANEMRPLKRRVRIFLACFARCCFSFWRTFDIYINFLNIVHFLLLHILGRATYCNLCHHMEHFDCPRFHDLHLGTKIYQTTTRNSRWKR